MGWHSRSGGAPSRNAILLPCFSCGKGRRQGAAHQRRCKLESHANYNHPQQCLEGAVAAGAAPHPPHHNPPLPARLAVQALPARRKRLSATSTPTHC